MSVDLKNVRGMLKFFKKMKKTLLKVDDLNVYIFPEGERNKNNGRVQKFQSGAEKIAKANKLDVVPVFIEDQLEKVFEDAPYAEKRTVTVYVGDVITQGDLESNYKALLNVAAKDHSEE